MQEFSGFPHLGLQSTVERGTEDQKDQYKDKCDDRDHGIQTGKKSDVNPVAFVVNIKAGIDSADHAHDTFGRGPDTAERGYGNDRSSVSRRINLFDDLLDQGKDRIRKQEFEPVALTAALEYGGRKGKHIITTKMEHPAVLRTCEYLERTGRAEVTYLDVPSDGVVRPEQIAQALRPDTVLISVMLANNEVGTIQPIREISEIARANGILLHTDAVQAVGHIPVDVKELQADLLSASGHKLYGPKGTGFLYVRKGLRLPPLIHGGRQEKGRRAGTENIPGVTGMGIAAELAAGSLDQHMEQERRLRDYMIGKMQAEIPHCSVNGSLEKRLPGNVNL